MQNLKDPLKALELLINKNNLDEARQLLTSVNLPESYFLTVSAAIALKGGDPQKAEVEFLKAIDIDPKNILAAGNLATLFFGQKKLKKAQPYAEIAFKNAPKNENFARIYAACLSDGDQHAEAVKVLEPFTRSKKPSLEALLAYSAVLRGDLRPDESLLVLERAQHLYPDREEAQRGIADVYSELDPIVAAREFEKIEKKLPNNLQVKWNASFVELRLRNFERGWSLYETGLTEKIGRIGRPLPPQVKGLPLITDLKNLNPDKWTIFSAEQGLGDQVLFLGCLREALADFPKSVLVGEDRMIKILQRSFPNLPIYPYALTQAISKQTQRINGVFPIGSLMKHFRKTTESFAAHRTSYLIPDEERIKKYREKLQQNTGKKRIVGLSWRGGYWERQKRTKSFELEFFESLLSWEDTKFVCLQYGDITAEREYAKKRGWPIVFIDGINFTKQIDEWVALACACDRVVSVSTALVHFLGAAGRQVDLLIGLYQAPFIWGLEGGKSLPYETVFIHRQQKQEGTAAFFSRLAKEIK